MRRNDGPQGDKKEHADETVGGTSEEEKRKKKKSLFVLARVCFVFLLSLPDRKKKRKKDNAEDETSSETNKSSMSARVSHPFPLPAPGSFFLSFPLSDTAQPPQSLCLLSLSLDSS